MAVYAYLVLILTLNAFSEADAHSYASLESPDGFFNLQWTYNNSTLIFKMTCKSTGWCAVGFTTTADGHNMVNYDIAVGGYASVAGYVDGYYSTTVGLPPKDATPNYELIKASEDGGKTVVEFSRIAVTGDNDDDIEFKDNTEVIVVWASHSSSDANTGLSKHTRTGVLNKHNLIKEAMAAMQPTPNDSASVVVSSVVSVLLILSACLLSF